MTLSPDVLATTRGERMRIARKRAGLTIEEMRVALAVHRNSVSAWENDRQLPPRTVLLAWALVTGCPMSWLDEGVVPDLPEPSTRCYVARRDRRPWHPTSRRLRLLAETAEGAR